MLRMMQLCSAAAYGDNNFQPVALRQYRFAMQALRHDLAVALHRNALAGVAEQFEQGSYRKRSGKIAAFTVDDEVHGARDRQQT